MLCDNNNIKRVFLGRGKYKYTKSDGMLLTETIFSDGGEFKDGFAYISIDGKGWNHIDVNGNYLSKKWFCYTTNFRDGAALIIHTIDQYDEDEKDNKKRKYNFINKNGNLILNYSVDLADRFNDTFALIHDNNKGYNFIDVTGKIMFEEWLEFGQSFRNKFALVKIKNKGYNFIDMGGTLVYDNMWFTNYSYCNALAAYRVRTNKSNWLLRDDNNNLSHMRSWPVPEDC